MSKDKPTKEKILNSITCVYKGVTKSYHVTMFGAGEVYQSENYRDARLFAAELKARILTA